MQELPRWQFLFFMGQGHLRLKTEAKTVLPYGAGETGLPYNKDNRTNLSYTFQ